MNRNFVDYARKQTSVDKYLTFHGVKEPVGKSKLCM